MDKNRIFEGTVVRLQHQGPELVMGKRNVHPYKLLDGLEGKNVRILVEIERTCSCGAKTFNATGECWKCEEEERAFEADYS